MYGEGGNHFMHAIRRNPDITNIVCNNMIYRLTKGQGIADDLDRNEDFDPALWCDKQTVESVASRSFRAARPFVARASAADAERRQRTS